MPLHRRNFLFIDFRMSDQFTRYEQDLLNLIKTNKVKLADKFPVAENNEKKSILRLVGKDVDDMNTIINDMEFELNKFGPNSRSSMSNKLKQYKLDVELIQKDLKKATNEASRYKNYDSISQNVNEIQNDPERLKVLQIHKSLTSAGESIVRSTQIAVETEQIGNSVLGELNDQGERLRQVNETLDGTRVALSKSRRLLNKLGRGIFYNKFLLVVIIILEIVALGGIIYWKFFT